MPCNLPASPNLHGVAFFTPPPCAMFPYMERKHKNYVREWRLDRGLSQKQLVARLIELAGDGTPDDPELRVPTTEASLSRIENGKQNFHISTLEALADALDIPEAGWLLDRKPGPAAEVISLVDRLEENEKAQAQAVLEAMFGKGAA